MVSCHRISSIVLILFTTTAFIAHVYLLVLRFQQYDTVTEWQTVNRIEPMFPDVHLCDSAEYSKTREEQSIISTDKFSVTAVELGMTRAQAFWRIALGHDISKLGLYDRSLNRISRRSLQPYTTSFSLGHHKQDSIVRCFYGSKPCDVNNFTERWYPGKGNCIRFRPSKRTISENGRSSGASLVLFANDRDFYVTEVERLNMFSGFYLSLTEPDHIPSFRNAIELPVVSVTPTVHKRVKLGNNGLGCNGDHWNQGWTHHNIYGRYQEPFVAKYSKFTCSWLKKQTMVHQRCGCYADAFYIPASHVAKPQTSYYCSHIANVDMLVNSEYKAVNSTHVYIGQPMNVTVSQSDIAFTEVTNQQLCMEKVLRKRIKADCPDRCRESKYSMDVTKRPWPQKFKYTTNLDDEIRAAVNHSRHQGLYSVFEDIFSLNQSSTWFQDNGYIRQSFLLVNIFSSTSEVMLAKESLVYPATNVLSDFGGTLGLWLGCSVISIAQLMWRCVCKPKKFKVLKKQQSRNSKAPKLEPIVFKISNQ